MARSQFYAQRPIETGATPGGAGHAFVVERHAALDGGERVALQIEVLFAGRDPHIGDFHVLIVRQPYAMNKLLRLLDRLPGCARKPFHNEREGNSRPKGSLDEVGSPSRLADVLVSPHSGTLS